MGIPGVIKGAKAVVKQVVLHFILALSTFLLFAHHSSLLPTADAARFSLYTSTSVTTRHHLFGPCLINRWVWVTV